MKELDIRIDPELEALIRPLTAEEFNQLRDSILEEGECHDPICIWREPGTNYYVIVDGHNRWKVIQENPNIYYETKILLFDDRDAAKKWMYLNQLSRRNLTDYERAQYALKLKPLLAAEAKKRQGQRSDLKDIPQKSAGSDVRDELAKMADVSHDTISKVEKIEAKASPEVKEKARKGEISINKAHELTVGKKASDSITIKFTRDEMRVIARLNKDLHNQYVQAKKSESGETLHFHGGDRGNQYTKLASTQNGNLPSEKPTRVSEQLAEELAINRTKRFYTPRLFQKGITPPKH